MLNMRKVTLSYRVEFEVIVGKDKGEPTLDEIDATVESELRDAVYDMCDNSDLRYESQSVDDLDPAFEEDFEDLSADEKLSLMQKQLDVLKAQLTADGVDVEALLKQLGET